MAKRTEPESPKTRTLHELRVSLEELKPEIWRLIRVRSDATLGQLHGVLQAAMGWTNSHLHQFLVGDDTYSDPRVEDADDEFEVTLQEVLPRKGAALRYEYDFGDSWLHRVEVTDIVEAPPRAPRAVCLGGERACPPDDVGGVGGYEELLEALGDPRHERHEELTEWLESLRSEYAEFDPRFEGPFDPRAFDVTATNKMIRKLTRGKRWECVVEADEWVF